MQDTYGLKKLVKDVSIDLFIQNILCGNIELPLGALSINYAFIRFQAKNKRRQYKISCCSYTTNQCNTNWFLFSYQLSQRPVASFSLLALLKLFEQLLLQFHVCFMCDLQIIRLLKRYEWSTSLNQHEQMTLLKLLLEKSVNAEANYKTTVLMPTYFPH